MASLVPDSRPRIPKHSETKERCAQQSRSGADPGESRLRHQGKRPERQLVVVKKTDRAQGAGPQAGSEGPTATELESKVATQPEEDMEVKTDVEMTEPDARANEAKGAKPDGQETKTPSSSKRSREGGGGGGSRKPTKRGPKRPREWRRANQAMPAGQGWTQTGVQVVSDILTCMKERIEANERRRHYQRFRRQREHRADTQHREPISGSDSNRSNTHYNKRQHYVPIRTETQSDVRVESKVHLTEVQLQTEHDQ